jgi:hypothetical protein
MPTPERSRAPSHPLPVDPPASAREWCPHELLEWRPPRMVVKNGGAFVETASVPRVRILEQLEIEMVTKLVAQRAQECSIRCDFLAYRRPHPQPDVHRAGVIVAEQFGRPVLPHSQRSGCEHADSTRRDYIGEGGLFQKLRTSTADSPIRTYQIM